MSEKLRIGVFGGYRGSSMIQVLLHHPDAELVAVCDKYQPLLDKAKAEAEAAGSWPPQAVRARAMVRARIALIHLLLMIVSFLSGVSFSPSAGNDEKNEPLCQAVHGIYGKSVP